MEKPRLAGHAHAAFRFTRYFPRTALHKVGERWLGEAETERGKCADPSGKPCGASNQRPLLKQSAGFQDEILPA